MKNQLCGITGWIHFNYDLTNKRDVISSMTSTLSKRGPDDTNYFIRPHVLFGHQRLVVVDPEGGKQPMTIEHYGSSYTLCYNGELYNTEDLRKELLLKGYSFKGHSDTEVLLTAYIEWKEKCVELLNGIFAFAVWDEKEQKVFLARDRLGVKPLFFSEVNGGLIFGSEIKSLLAHPSVKAVVTREGLSEIFGLGPSRTPGHGVFRDIKELRPAYALRLSTEGLKIWNYWSLKSEQHTESLEETALHLRDLFEDAVTRQLVSDVPLCTFLSGGVDSSAITAIAANHYKERGKQLHTFSIDYEDNQKFFKANDFQPHADGPWIEKVSKEFNTIHHSCVISQDKLAEYLIEAVHVRDLPGMADIDSSLLWFCKEIRKDFVVGLSGECADEIFGGYPWFHRIDDINREGFPWMRSTSMRQELLKQEWREKLNLKESVMQRYKETVKETPLLEGESEEDCRRRELFYLNMLWFMANLLDRKDRMSMGASIEVRVPFADHRLVEYVWNIPWEMKMTGNREKGILRKALDGILPNEVLYRKKSPYPKTHNPAYTKAVMTWLHQILEDSHSPLYEFFDSKQLREIVNSGGKSFTVPWFGQLMSGPQLLAHLGQIHVWFTDYQVQVVE